MDGTDRSEVAVPGVATPPPRLDESGASRSRHAHHRHGPGMLRRAFHGSRRAPAAALAALVVLAFALWPLLARRLDWYPWFRMSDLQVYRSAGESLVQGRALYDYLTPVPQLLPFTYPPFAAIVALPLTLMSPTVTNWVWTLASLAVLFWIILVSFRPLVRRFPDAARPAVVAGLSIAMAYTLPVRDCFHFGQVGIFLAGLCLLDCVVPKTRWPRGLMIGFAAAVKLVPAVFIPYLWLTGRRRAAVVATSWFAGFSVAAAIALPRASKEYWTSAIFASGRLGDNAGTSNQAVRGALLRALPGSLGTALWLLSVAVIVVVSYRWARRASLSGFEVRGVAIVGMLSVLVSPVSWIHHFAGWVPIMLGALVDDGRQWRRVLYLVVGATFFILQLPWWGARIAAKDKAWHIPALFLQDAFMFGALLAVWLLGRMAARTNGRTSASPGSPGVQGW